jgi:hypothetical protein
MDNQDVQDKTKIVFRLILLCHISPFVVGHRRTECWPDVVGA